MVCHQNIGFYEQPTILMELTKNNEDTPLIIEMNQLEVEQLLVKLKEIHKFI